MADAKLVAKSASDKTDDWPFWMVWDGRTNVTIKVIEELTGRRFVCMPFGPRSVIEQIVEKANEIGITG